jgi:hypothetical protein
LFFRWKLRAGRDANKHQLLGYPPPRYYQVIDTMAIDPADPKTIYAAVAPNLNSDNVNCWKIHLY